MTAPELGKADRIGLLRRVGIAALILLAVTQHATPSAGETESAGDLEHRVKAAFLYNFAKFIEWPPESFQDSGARVILGILGNGMLCDVLDRTLQGKSVNGRVIEVRRLRSAEEARSAQILFVSSTLGKDPGRILRAIKGLPILTVGDAEGFGRAGGIINFRIEDNKVRFEINIDAASRARLRISSKLLTMARIVHDDTTREN